MHNKKWTIMIYMAGDNNLAVDMAYAMEQIKGVAAEGADSPNLFVYYDGNSPSIPTLYCDFSEPKNPRYVRSYKVPNKLYGPTRKRNENAADRQSILNFVDWCVNSVQVEKDGEISFGRRAQNYALIFSGHSLGFQDIGLFKDETSGKSMTMFDLYGVLQQMTVTKEQLVELANQMGWEGEKRKIETTELLGKKLAILGFDSCVMGMLEVGYQFERVAETMIVSEGSVPSAGWTYAKLLGCLTREGARKLPSQTVAELFVKQFVRSQDAYTVGGVSVDMAAWNMEEFVSLSAAFDGLATALLECFEDKNSRIYRQMERVILKVHWQCQSYMYDQNVDLGDFCELLDRECELVAEELGASDAVDILRLVQEQCRVVQEQLKLTVILSGFSGGSYQYSNGVAVFFPWSREGYEVSRKNYETLWYSDDLGRDESPWNQFLDKYLNDVTLRRCEPTTADAAPGVKYRYISGVKFSEMSVPGFTALQQTKLAGHEGTKLAGHEGTKLAGHEGTKLAGHEGTKLAGHEGTKLAGGGSNTFFNSLRLFKNIESRWDISGFTKKPHNFDD